MIDCYTIKFCPAASHKELEKALCESGDTPNHTLQLEKLKTRIEFIADFEELRKVAEFVKQLARKSETMAGYVPG
jgi:hypothetical protein